MESIEKELLKPKLTLSQRVMETMEFPLTLVSYNVHFGKNTRLIKEIFEQNEILKKADIILLQEIEDHVIEHHSRAEKLAASMGYHCVYAPAQIRKQKGTHGLAILSRLPIKRYQVIPLLKYNLLFRDRSRIALSADLELNGKIIRVCNIHLDLPLSAEDRMSQIRPVIEHLKKQPADGLVFAGDLNTAPLHWFKHGIPVGYSNQREFIRQYMAEEGFNIASHHRGYTHVSPLGWINLDGIYASGVNIMDYGVEADIDVSDHRPLWAKFKV